jgi:hypothetical protein
MVNIVKTGTQTPIDDIQSLHDWCLGLLEDGRSMRRAHEAQWWENLATYTGDLWVEYDMVTKRLYELDKPDYRVRLPINLAQPAVRTEYAKLLKNRPIVRCIARSQDRVDLNSAKIGDQLLNDYAERQFSLPKVRRRALQWVLICGAGGVFVDYDPTLHAKVEVPVDLDGNPQFSESEVNELQQLYRERHQRMSTTTVQQGDVIIKPASPWQWVFDFSKFFVEEAAWGIYTEVMDVDEVYRRWGAEIQGDKGLKPGVVEKRLMAKATNQVTATAFDLKNPSWQHLAEVHRMYVLAGHRYFPEGAHIVFTNEEILWAETFPYAHGQIPLSVMGHIPLPTSQHPLSIIQQVKPVVLEISKTESQMIENRNMMANPPWIEYRQQRIEGDIENRPGMRLELDFHPNIPEPHPIEMPGLPNYVMNLPELLGQHVLEITGQNETAQGQVPPGARSGVAIAYLTEENDTKLGPTVMEWEEMNERFSWQTLSNFAQYYDAPRTVHLTKAGSGDMETLDFMGSMLSGVDGVKVQAGSALPRSLAAKQQFTLDLYDRGLIRNPRTIMDMLDVGEGEADEWEKDMKQQERENLKLGQGVDVRVEEWHNHEAHLYVVHDFMKSADFEEENPMIQANYHRHEQEHQIFMARKQQQQLMMQQGAGANAPGQGGGQGGGGNGPAGTANGVNQPQGPSGPYSSPDDIGAVAQSGMMTSPTQ